MEVIKNLLFPKLKCPVCSEFSEGICTPCSLNFIKVDYKFINKEKLKGVSLYKDEGSALKLVNNFKVKASFNSLDEIVWRIILANEDFIKQFDFIAYPPSLKSSMNKSGIDHTYELARSVSRKLSVPLIKALFKRSKKDQKNLDKFERNERAKNIKINSKIDIKRYKNRNILIIDDIYITGSTIQRCIEILEEKEIKVGYLTFIKAEI